VIFKMKIKNFQMMEEKNQQLMDTLIQADEASQAKSRFLARMSHEIRTPMNAIVGLTEIAKKHLTDPNRIEQYLSKIDSASHVLLNIINDVLDMSAIKNNKLKIAHEKFDMKKIINSITAIYYNQCKQKGIKLEVISACLTHEILIGDSLRVNQIILNLISNASKFTPAGGKIRFEITEKAYKKQTIFIRIIVSDTGIGMTPEMLTRLFNTFEQENANTAQQYGGSGLGLSIVKNLVELMHGSISVESKKGIGSMFTVDLPFSIPEIDELSSSKSINDLRVLVVDNDCASRIYMTSILDRINVQYDIATTTEQTVKMLSTADKAGKHYDICFIDCKASFADSITLTKNIRKIYDKKALVIILSAYDISEIGENMETSGADIFLQKPLFQSTVFNMLISLTDKNYIKGTFHKESYDFHGKKVLLAEDNALNTEIAIELLNSVNLNVDHAENGQIAVDKFLTAPIGTYDIILMDIQMPVMNGYQATKTIRSSSHPNAKSIPIFAMTADAFTENVAEALSAGMNGHIAKPIDTHILYRTLCNCLRQA
ncbi:response regulator, partial [Phascolarctobacterium faecium]